jgi:uncharacterized repeat protein (TIGR03803 family)
MIVGAAPIAIVRLIDVPSKFFVALAFRMTSIGKVRRQSSPSLVVRVERRAHLRTLVAAAIIALVAPATTTAQQAFTVLHTFTSGADGARPTALIQATDGNFYGTTATGGGSAECPWAGGGCGTVFTMTPAGAVTILHAFAGGTDGAVPLASLMQATDGNFYGTTFYGGGTDAECEHGCGTVFKMTPAGTVTIVHAFAGGTDGASPRASLIQATDGSFYGTTIGGGSGAPGGTNAGTVFKMTPAGMVTILHGFAGSADGATPFAALTQATDGNFYGTTVSAGALNHGTVFMMTPAGTVTVLHAFAGGADGAMPKTALIQAADGTFYGTTAAGGASDSGTVFTMTPAGTVNVLHSFAGGAEGDDPEAALIQATNGNFYGTTYSGGGNITACTTDVVSGNQNGCGTVFMMTPTGAVTVLHAFASGTDGATPLAALIQATDGSFYGTTYFGGDDNNGLVFELNPAAAPTITTQPQSQTIASGQTASLSVVASGSALTYQWYVGTTGTITDPITGATSSSYTTSGLTSTMSYWVEVFNSGTAADSTTATVAVATPPTIAIQPTNRTVTAGRQAAFTVATNGVPAPGLQWQASTDGGSAWFNLSNTSPYSGVTTTTLTVSSVAAGLNGTEYRCVATNGLGSSTSNAAMLTVRPEARSVGDFDGDGKSDMTVFRPPSGIWYILRSSTAYTTNGQVAWGLSTDKPVPGDYDGDGRTDPAVFRPSTGTWYVLNSSTSYTTSTSFWWGVATDIPVPADYDGDGKVDPAVYRPSTGQWFILTSSSNYEADIVVSWGISTDVPLQGDYDGDGKADPAVYRASTGEWFILNSSTNYTTSIVKTWGLSTDIPVSGDYDGDGVADPAVYRPSTGQWFILKSTTNYTTDIVQSWGISTDIPVAGDYDGDGITDPAVYRPSTGQWFFLYSRTSYTTSGVNSWGIDTDIPIGK